MPASRLARVSKRRLRPLRDGRSGVVGPAVAVLGASLLTAAGLALDLGLYYMGSRDLRSATEAAALAAAMDPAQAQARATDYLIRNGYSASVLKSVEVGYYCANITWASASRFVPGRGPSADCPGSRVQNAVRLKTGKVSRRFLSGVLGGASPIPELAATASAARVDEAGISVTSGHLTVTNTLLNAVNNLLGAIVGTQLRLSTAEIEALMSGNVDAGKFFEALARNTGQTGTYHDVAQRTYGLDDLANAAADAAHDPATGAALHSFANAAGNNYRVPLAGMFGLGVWKNMPVDTSVPVGAPRPPSLRAGLNAYQLITYAAQAGPGVIDATDLVSLAVPNSTVRITAVASNPADRPRYSFGPAGETEVGTSMLRLRTEIELVNLGIPGILNAQASVPLVLDVAAAQSEVTAIDCVRQSEQSSQTNVTVHTKSGLVNGYIGNLTKPNGMSRAMPTLTASDFERADIFRLNVLFLGLASLKAKTVVTPLLGETHGYPTFGPGGGVIGSPQAPGTGMVIGNRAMVGSTIQVLSNSLLGSNSVQSCLVGSLVCVSSDAEALGNLNQVLSRVGALLGNTADPLLDNVLAALGVQLGHATVWVNGARCGVPVLI